jgi:Domain of unknown function (DUF4282)
MSVRGVESYPALAAGVMVNATAFIPKAARLDRMRQRPPLVCRPLWGHFFERFQLGRNIMDGKGFIASLFDFSFTEMITPKVIKLIYVLLVAVSGLITLGIIIAGFSQGVAAGLLTLILSPLFFLWFVFWSRVYLEFIIAYFHIYENTRVLAQHAQKIGEAPAPSPTA